MLIKTKDLSIEDRSTLTKKQRQKIEKMNPAKVYPFDKVRVWNVGRVFKFFLKDFGDIKDRAKKLNTAENPQDIYETILIDIRYFIDALRAFSKSIGSARDEMRHTKSRKKDANTLKRIRQKAVGKNGNSGLISQVTTISENLEAKFRRRQKRLFW